MLCAPLVAIPWFLWVPFILFCCCCVAVGVYFLPVILKATLRGWRYNRAVLWEYANPERPNDPVYTQNLQESYEHVQRHPVPDDELWLMLAIAVVPSVLGCIGIVLGAIRVLFC